jgi:hypothetical protein
VGIASSAWKEVELMTESTPPTGINVTTKFRPVQFLLYLCKPKLVIDNGEPVVIGWGKSFVPLAPGEHTVSCYVRYLYLSRAMESLTTVHVGPGQVIELRWKARWIIFSPGIWSRT